jgi:hypothetical protein
MPFEIAGDARVKAGRFSVPLLRIESPERPTQGSARKKRDFTRTTRFFYPVALRPWTRAARLPPGRCTAPDAGTTSPTP